MSDTRARSPVERAGGDPATIEARLYESVSVMDEMGERGRPDLYDLAYDEYRACCDALTILDGVPR